MLDDPDMVQSDVVPLLGQQVALTVTFDQVTLAAPTEAQLAAAAAAAGEKAEQNKEVLASGFSTEAGGAVSKVNAPRLMSLLDCMPSLAGAKASACARLEQVWNMGVWAMGVGMSDRWSATTAGPSYLKICCRLG